ncbi:hypothetical protein AVEN_137926-1 [Araneus ventricosus]|uniref:Uncharacterized protein n=1 Tax=Araneus ventricosus TaxID=182803 RepID=A0A4Y2T6S3_ARAVE|nr:hypothetical protein AVEN_137926-1 [Araneus ventricosus]
MIPLEHEISPHSHVGETVHEVFKKEEKIQEVDSQLGNKEVSREISRETTNTVSRKLSEDSKPIMNSKLIASHPQEIPNKSINFRSGDKNLVENYLLNSPVIKNPEPFEQANEIPQKFSPFVKGNDMKDFENERNHFLSGNSHDRPSYYALSDSSIPKPIITRQSNLEEINNLPIDLGKMKNHPIDFGEIKNYTYFNIRKDENNDGSNRKNLLGKRTVEILVPNIPSKNNKTAPAGLQLSNPIWQNNRNHFLKYQLQKSDGNYPDDQKYSGSKIFENSDAFLVPQQSNAASPGHLNFVEQNPNPEESNLFPGELAPRKQNGDQFNAPPQENLGNILTAEGYEDNVKRRETPVNVETIISHLLGTSSNKKKRNASPSPVNNAEVLRRKKKSHKAIHKDRRHV